MAGHSKFKNIQHRKGAQDKKKAKIFTKVVRDIISAAKSGGIDPESNSRLRHAISIARGANLPKERIDRALKQSSSDNSDEYSEIRYEGFASGGIAIIIEALTDNKNRTASCVRSIFTKHGGNLGETGSVSFMFDHLGILSYSVEKVDGEKVMELALEIDAVDIISDEENHTFYTTVGNFASSVETLAKFLGDPTEAAIGWRPQNTILVDDLDKAKTLLKMINALEEDDDVQNVYANYEFPDEFYEKLNQ